MKHYVGLDVSLKEVSICVVDADGVVAAEGTRRPVRASSGIPLEYFTRAQLTKLVQLLKRRKYSWADGLECTDTVVGAI